MRRFTPVLCVLALLAIGIADAQSVVAPGAATTLAGSSGLNTLLRNSGNPRTYQLGIAASELSAIPRGAVIVGLSWRSYLGTAATWPTVATSWKNYDITFAEAALPVGSFSTTFAANMKNAVPVRKGPMTIPVGAYPVTTTKPHPFTTFYADFQMPYVYQGGDLAILFSHDGSDQSTFVYQETATLAATTGQALTASTYNAATGAAASFILTRIHYGYGPAGGVGTKGSLNLILSNNLVSPTPAPGSINLAVTNGVPSAPGAIFISPTPAAAPIPLPGSNNLLILPAFIGIVPFGLNAQGRHDLNLTFPALTFGVEVQAYAADPGNKAGFVVTNAVSFVAKP